MTDGRQEHRLGLAGLLCRRRHLLQRLFHFHAGADVHQHTDRHILVTVTGMNKADLQVVVITGHHIHKVHLLFADDARNAVTVFVGQQVDVVMRQFITQNVGAVTDTQNTNTHRCRGDNLAVELFMLLQPEGVVFCRQEHFALKQPGQAEQHNGRQHIQQHRIED
ncbi:hypothetical protein D3C78_957640 [compost metagenome]